MLSLGALTNPRVSAMLKLNGTNHEQWIESLMMNLTNMKLDLALKMEAPPVPTAEVSENERTLYDEWEHSNRCCLMFMRYHMEKYICDIIPNVENAKEFLAAIEKKYKKLPKYEKYENLNMLHSTTYDGVSGIRNHIDKLMACYHKLRALGMDLGEDYMVWRVMENLPSQFDSIISSYYSQKEQWSIEEMTAILAKEEDDVKKGRAMSVSILTNKNSGQKRSFTPSTSGDHKSPKKKIVSAKGNGQNACSSSSGHKNEAFKGKCNFCHKPGRKKADCWKLKAYQEKKGSDKQKETR